MKYRPEIDGLRTIAVFAVIFYHAEIILFGRNWLTGGFIGVDVFFVISGYLISKIILTELQETGKVNYLHFYERRARRIIPVLLVVIAASFPFAWLLLTPMNFSDYAISILSSLGFVSNFFFYFSTTEYGAESSLLMPFLHTWSLSIEEQFYVLFPLVALALHRLFPRHKMAAFGVLLMASLAFAEFMQGRNPDLNFYLLPSRAWELLSGTLLAAAEMRWGRRTDNFFGRFAPSVGLILLLVPLTAFSNETPHPSIYTVIPVAGTSLVIYFSNPREVVFRILSSKYFVALGLISYSLYLWHFPIFAYMRMISADFGLIWQISGILLTIVLSMLSYTFVEQPFRKRSFISPKKFTIGFSTVTAALACGLLIVPLNGGDFGRFDHLRGALANYEPDNRKLRARAVDYMRDVNNESFPSAKDVDVLVLGNSHSADIFNMFATNQELFPNAAFVRRGIQVSCFMTSNIRSDRLFETNEYAHADIVVISTRYRDQPCDNGSEILIEKEDASDLIGVENLVRRVISDGKIPVVMSHSIEFPHVENKIIYDYLFDQIRPSSEVELAEFRLEVNSRYYSGREGSDYINRKNSQLRDISERFGAVYLDKEELICSFEESLCFGLTDDFSKSFPDTHHFTLEGAEFFGRRAHEIGWFQPAFDAFEERLSTYGQSAGI